MELELLTQPPRRIIKHRNLVSLRIDNSLVINRLRSLSTGADG